MCVVELTLNNANSRTNLEWKINFGGGMSATELNKTTKTLELLG